MGYFSDNEMVWWHAPRLEEAFKAGPASRVKLAELLRRWHDSFNLRESR